jgi:hypothetical protein
MSLLSCIYNTQGVFTCKFGNVNTNNLKNNQTYLNNYNKKDNTTVHGYQLYKSSADNLINCSQLCNNDNNCKAFFLDSNSKSCNLVTGDKNSVYKKHSTLYTKQ